jgi:Fe-S-cluster containining protein
MGSMNQEIKLNDTAIMRIRAQEEFICEHCGNCCTLCFPLEVNERDIRRWADYFKKTLKITIRRHVKTFKEGKQTKLAIKTDRPCKFYIPGKGCRIYQVRPEICKKFPFLSGEDANSEHFVVMGDCPGAVKVYERMLKDGEVKTIEEKS